MPDNQIIYIISYFTFKDKKTLVGGLRPYRLYEYLKAKGYTVKLVTPKSFLGDEIVIPEVFWPKSLQFLLRIIPPDRSILWGIKAYFFMQKLLKNQQALIFTTVPPQGLGIVGYLLKKKFSDQVRWVADYRDLWTKNPLHSRFFIKKWIDPILEKSFHKVADLVVLNTKWDLTLHQELFPFLKEKSVFVRNGVDVIIPEGEDRKLSFVYAGGTTKGEATGYVIKILEVLNANGIVAHCDFYGEYDTLMDQSPFITYHGSVSPEMIASILPKYKFGFIYLPKGCENGGRVAQKFYDYLGARIIPICFRPSREMVALMDDLGVGIKIFDDTKGDTVFVKLKKASFTVEDNQLLSLTRTFQFDRLLEVFINKNLL